MEAAEARLLRRGRLLVVIAVVLILAAVLARSLVELYVEVLWFGEVGYSSVFWTRTLWLFGARLVAGIVVAALLYFNLRYVARTLGGIQIKRRFGNLEISEQIPRGYALGVVLGISCLFGLWFGSSVGAPLAEHVLLVVQGIEWGVADPILGRDASFYVFDLPLLRAAVNFLMSVTFLVFAVCAAGYGATGSLRFGKAGVIMGDQPRMHLGVIVASFVLMMAIRFWLVGYFLLLDGNSQVQGIFGFADAAARLPAFQILGGLTALSAVLIFLGSWRNRLVPAVVGVGNIVVGMLVVAQLWPSLVQRFRVEPNELERESPYIEHNIRFTRIGFGLDGMSRESFDYGDQSTIDAAAAMAQTDGLPMWSEGTLRTTFGELEARYPYYHFPTIATDRYLGSSGPTPVAVAVREIDQSGIEPGWQNNHVRELYVTGMGAAVAAAAERSPEGRPEMFLSAEAGFNPGVAVPQDLRLVRRSVYVGASPQQYAIINPTDSAFLAVDGAIGEAGVDFPAGIALDSFGRKLALAWYWGTSELLFSQEVTETSRAVMRRQVIERVRAIAPFFHYPEPPYPVIHEGRIVWVLEGFTVTGFFPLSQPHLLQLRTETTYVRNSVKVTIDAVTGETSFYAMPEPDPLLEAFDSAFPGLLRTFDEMPLGLKSHLRYPRSLLSLQSAVLLQYHQESAQVFHRQQDVWDLPQEQFQGTTPEDYRPEYGEYRLPGEEAEGFHLTMAFVPKERQNLTAVLAGSLGLDGRPKLRLFEFPAEDQVPGPRQVEALVEQDPVISQQFSLWRTGGSQVWTGHLHLVPVGDRLLYVEPVFLAAEEDAIPELRRFVVSDGRRVAMEPELRAGVLRLSGDAEGRVRVGEIESSEVSLSTDVTPWSAEALELLDLAESRLREGDWEGFGEALAELRLLLQRTPSGGGE